jgi:hypothetical protein
MKLDEFLQHSKVHSRARQVYGNIRQTCAAALPSLCVVDAFKNVRTDATLGCACFTTADYTPITLEYQQRENMDEATLPSFLCGIHPVVVYHANIDKNITVNHNKFYQFCQ